MGEMRVETKITLSESMEDYLEAIFNLIRKNGSARVTDIANQLEIAASSVNQGLKKLNKKGLVTQEKYGPIKLTEAGLKTAEKIRCKHKILYLFLNKTLGVSKENADQDACSIEHALSDESFNIEKISAIFPKSNLKKIFILKPENDIYYPVQKHGFHKNSLTQFQLKSDNKIISKYLLNNKALYIKKHLLKKPFFKNHLQEKDFDEIDRIMLIPIKHKKNLVKIIGIAGVEI